MSAIEIQRFTRFETVPQRLLEYMESLNRAIHERAFDIFEGRKGGFGCDLDDWLQAERDLVLAPAVELLDDESAFKARIAVPGFEAKDVHVAALPDALVVQAESAHAHQDNGEHVHFCEFSGKSLFRKLNLPASVDVDKVTASHRQRHP